MRNFESPRMLLSLLVFLGAISRLAHACPDIDGLADLNCDQNLEIVAFGDSITFGRADEEGLGYPGRLNLLLPDVSIRNLGVPGENSYSGRARAARSFPTYPNADYAIVLEGVNDYWLEGRSARTTRDNVLSMIGSAENIGAVALLGNLTAIRRSFQKSWVSAVNAQINPYRDIDFFSLGEGIISSDLIHPNGAGYQSMSELALGVLRQASESNRPADSDGDGIYDFAESAFGGDPLNPDTDGDGLSDGDEVFSYGSSPASVDTDGDGFSDPEEVDMGSDPSDPRPGPPTLKSLEIVGES